jgi:hypothetical protein
MTHVAGTEVNSEVDHPESVRAAQQRALIGLITRHKNNAEGHSLVLNIAAEYRHREAARGARFLPTAVVQMNATARVCEVRPLRRQDHSGDKPDQ